MSSGSVVKGGNPNLALDLAFGVHHKSGVCDDQPQHCWFSLDYVLIFTDQVCVYITTAQALGKYLYETRVQSNIRPTIFPFMGSNGLVDDMAYG